MKRKIFAKETAFCRGLRLGGMTAIGLSLLGLTNAANAQQSTGLSSAFLPSKLFLHDAVTFNQIQVATGLNRIINNGVTETSIGRFLAVPVVLPQDSLPLFIQTQVDLIANTTNGLNPPARVQAVQFALDQLAPNLYTDLPFLTFSNTETVYGSLEQRMEELRFGAVSQPLPQEPTITGTSKGGKDIKNPVEPPPPSEQKWGTFAYLNGKFGTLDSDNNGFGFDYQAGGVVIGADYRLTDKVAIGIAGGYEYANLDPKFVGGNGSANAGYGAVYTTYGGPTGLYAEAIGGAGYTSFAIQRDVLGTSAHGYPDAWDASAGGTLGYMIKLTNNLGFAPFGQLFYDNLWRSGTSETGSIASLNVSHGSAETLDTIVGGKLVGSFYLGRVRLTNVLWAGYRHDYLQNVYAVSSSFLDGGIGSFVTQSPRFSADSIVAGAGVNADITSRFSVSVNYQAQANSDYIENLFTMGLKCKF
jgi:outer membrane autotransporter protein